MNIHPKERENKWIFKTINDLESHGIKSCTNLMLKEVSSFSIGGPCDLAVFPNNSTELIRSVEIALENNIEDNNLCDELVKELKKTNEMLDEIKGKLTISANEHES